MLCLSFCVSFSFYIKKIKQLSFFISERTEGEKKGMRLKKKKTACSVRNCHTCQQILSIWLYMYKAHTRKFAMCFFFFFNKNFVVVID